MHLVVPLLGTVLRPQALDPRIGARDIEQMSATLGLLEVAPPHRVLRAAGVRAAGKDGGEAGLRNRGNFTVSVEHRRQDEGDAEPCKIKQAFSKGESVPSCREFQVLPPRNAVRQRQGMRLNHG